MPDREKVIEALRICRESLGTKSCRKCPYMRGRDGTGTCYPKDAEENGVHLCWQDLVDDAIVLLKEREPRVMTLDEVLTADVVPAPVRCSDCRFYDKRDGGAPGGTGWCSRPGAGCGVPEGFFCAGAERKEEK